jgi:hypothetical protein
VARPDSSQFREAEACPRPPARARPRLQRTEALLRTPAWSGPRPEAVALSLTYSCALSTSAGVTSASTARPDSFPVSSGGGCPRPPAPVHRLLQWTEVSTEWPRLTRVWAAFRRCGLSLLRSPGLFWCFLVQVTVDEFEGCHDLIYIAFLALGHLLQSLCVFLAYRPDSGRVIRWREDREECPLHCTALRECCQLSSGRITFVPYAVKNAPITRGCSAIRERSAEWESLSCFARSFQYQSNRLR